MVIQKADENLEIIALLEMEADELDDVAIKGRKPYINVVQDPQVMWNPRLLFRALLPDATVT